MGVDAVFESEAHSTALKARRVTDRERRKALVKLAEQARTVAEFVDWCGALGLDPLNRPRAEMAGEPVKPKGRALHPGRPSFALRQTSGAAGRAVVCHRTPAAGQ